MESDLTLIIWAGLVLVAPPALLFWLVRRRRRRARALHEEALSAATAPTLIRPDPQRGAAPAVAPVQAAQSGGGYSFPYGVPLVVYPALAVVLAMAQRPWLMALLELLLVALALAFARQAFSRAAYEKVCANDPGMTLTTWRINWLVFFAAPPALLALFGATLLLRTGAA